MFTCEQIYGSSLGKFLRTTNEGGRITQRLSPAFGEMRIYEFDEINNRYRLSIPTAPDECDFIDLYLSKDGTPQAQRSRGFVRGKGFNGTADVVFSNQPKHIRLALIASANPDATPGIFIDSGYPDPDKEKITAQYNPRLHLLEAVHLHTINKAGLLPSVTILFTPEGMRFLTPNFKIGSIMPAQPFNPTEDLKIGVREQGSDIYVIANTDCRSYRLIAQRRFDPIEQIAEKMAKVGWDWLAILQALPVVVGLPKPKE